VLLKFSQMGTPNKSEDTMADKESVAQRISVLVQFDSGFLRVRLYTDKNGVWAGRLKICRSRKMLNR
jgi:hypothetical protein